MPACHRHARRWSDNGHGLGRPSPCRHWATHAPIRPPEAALDDLPRLDHKLRLPFPIIRLTFRYRYNARAVLSGRGPCFFPRGTAGITGWPLLEVMHRMVEKSADRSVDNSRLGAVPLDIRRISGAVARARINVLMDHADMVTRSSNQRNYRTQSSVSQCSPSKARGSQWRRHLRNRPNRDDAGAIPPRSRV